jgi:hypothetical protein
MSCIKVSNLGKVWRGWSFRGLTVLIILPLVLILTFGTIAVEKSEPGEPVPGADIFIEQEPDDEPIAHTTTDLNGNFSLTLILHPGTYTIHFKNAIITKALTEATGNKGGFAIGGFNAAIFDPGDSQEQDGDRVIFEVVTAYWNEKKSALTKVDSKKSLLFIIGEDKTTTLARFIVPKNKAPRKWRLEGRLVCVPVKKVVRFIAGSDLSKTVK